MIPLNKLTVLNTCNPVHIERESDVYVDYRPESGSWFTEDKMLKKCVSWHSIAACFETEFFVYKKDGWQNVYKYNNILLMVKDDIQELFPLVKKLKSMKKIVGIAFHENGNFFSMKSLDFAWLKQLKELVDQCDYFWNLNIPIEDMFTELFNVPVFSCWHGFPYEEWNHNFTVPKEKREGILIGTRTLNQNLKRNTLYSIFGANKVAKQNNTFSTFFCEDQLDIAQFEKYLYTLGLENIRVVKGPVSYEDWLKLIAKHKVLYHNDASDTLGQVVGDAALVDVISIGSLTVNSDAMFTSSPHLDNSIYVLSNFFDGKIRESLVKEFKEELTLKKLKQKHEKELFPKVGINV